MTFQIRPHHSEAGVSTQGTRNTYLLVLPWDLKGDVGGISQVVQSLYDGISRDGRLSPKALVLDWKASAPIDDHDGAGRAIVRFRLMSFEQERPLLISVPRYLLRLPIELFRLKRFVRAYRVGIVNCHYIGSSDLMWVIAKAVGLFRGKVILSIHGRDIRTLASATGFRWRLWRWVLQRADAVVACSEGLAAETRDNFVLPSAQVVTIHNGFDAARLGHLLELGNVHRPAPDRGPSLINLGTFEHKKGHDILLRAFKNVLSRFPSANLTIMGRRAETADSTMRLVDELGLASHVTIRCDVPHELALQALSASDMFVLSSRNEAFSIALLEAGAFGKPIVATTVCGVSELIEDGVTGVLVQPEHVEDLTRGILEMLDAPQMAIEYGRRIRERVLARFSASQTSRNYLQLVGYGVCDAGHSATELADAGVATSHVPRSVD
jgi:glycosyltransferase involved in cell wall biosynthesis